MAATGEHDEAEVVPIGLWVDELLSTELDLNVDPDAVFDRHTVTTKRSHST